MTTTAFCEIDPFCRKILKQHWPNVPIFDDIRTLSGDDVGPVDLICGGYPCQPFSVAGKQRGKADDRHLWPEYYRLIQEIHPRWIIGENVAGHIKLGLDDVLSDLEEKVTPGNRLLFQLAPSTPRIEETGYGLWATPNTMDYLPQRSAEATIRHQKESRRNRTRPGNLREQVNPETMRLWPTVRASEYKDTGPVGSKSHQHMKNRNYLCAQVKEESQPTGMLNPTWVEWLMGYPTGWTELKR